MPTLEKTVTKGSELVKFSSSSGFGPHGFSSSGFGPSGEAAPLPTALLSFGEAEGGAVCP